MPGVRSGLLRAGGFALAHVGQALQHPRAQPARARLVRGGHGGAPEGLLDDRFSATGPRGRVSVSSSCGGTPGERVREASRSVGRASASSHGTQPGGVPGVWGVTVVVVAVAALGNRWAGALAASSAVAWFDFFHTEPYQSFDIRDRADVETAVLLLLVGLAVSQLAARARVTRSAAGTDAELLERLHRAMRMPASGGHTPQELIDRVRHDLVDVQGPGPVPVDARARSRTAAAGGPARRRRPGGAHRARTRNPGRGGGRLVDRPISRRDGFVRSVTTGALRDRIAPRRADTRTPSAPPSSSRRRRALR
ncbi:DUF4118 domain-containing protein [Streptomyces sp. NPDC047974]|uniref:DUF4118 domain-containing protein n=1 Tax=Streptomyces sp. NPDC047974 TaxID=3154343 RepID=UPI0033EB8AB3